ncbi:polyhydroxyalkanoic acid system family protein [Bythopirellula goksoeyrii]|uniref:Polyhydroxyalkanoic acid system protein (PHA_gran_rgn) n=1 Tax=Bythopirellula goksoeyrii TaxID=1400387 RepID=A0A5B9QFJ6_9BACT|nr:polyhydroxyalkanoic acid system family protein [Bythopirellula goksoeyrii]QEG36669.1 Putative polyhydroxyalkanoic acid system protein (PHA_gran_rgn) [Bythopirellula goksoeyrii]
MPKLQLEVPHTLPQNEAQDRLQRFTESIHGKFGDQAKDVTQSWSDNVLTFGFKTLGMRIDGNIAVEPEKLVVNGDLPMAAMMFKGKIESEIRQQLERLVRV